MDSQPHRPPISGGFKATKRQAITANASNLVTFGDLNPNQSLPVLVQPAMPGVNLGDWIRSHLSDLQTQLLQRGGILFRGFSISTVESFEELIRSVSGHLLTYTNRSTPRTQVSGNIYTSTEFPADQSIPMHNEMSYTNSWPRKIWFFSVKNADQQGETPIADSHLVYQRLPEELREEFARKRVMYVRNYGAGVDLPWQDVFQTQERTEVEQFCRENGIQWEWKSGDGLRTRQVCQAVTRHPETGVPLWFNQAHLFHISSLKPEIQSAMTATFAPEDLPRNSFFGDGSQIPVASLDVVRRVYDQTMVVFPWQVGDILLLDNMKVAHGRRPFVGQRKVVVGMAEAFDNRERIAASA